MECDNFAGPTNWIGPKPFFPLRELSDLPVIDRVIVWHNHYDHLAAVERVRWAMPLGVDVLLNQLSGAAFLGPAASSIGLRYSGLRLHWPGRNAVCAKEPIPASGGLREDSQRFGWFDLANWRLTHRIRCGRR